MPAPLSPLRLMAILAHPDDESLGLGGTLSKYASEGVETYVVTATRGEAGRHLGHRAGDAEHPGAQRLGEIREAELRAAAAVLGVRGVTVLDYRDQHLDRADPPEIIGQLAAELRRVRPHVVITFGPDGAYGHPDHVAICQFATAAVAVAAFAGGAGGDPPHLTSKLYYIAWSRTLWSTYQEAYKKMTVTVDGVERQAVPWPDWEITTVVESREFWPTAWRAICCHASQMVGYEALAALPPAQHEELWGMQSFYRALSTVTGGRARERDLFEGLRSA